MSHPHHTSNPAKSKRKSQNPRKYHPYATGALSQQPELPGPGLAREQFGVGIPQSWPMEREAAGDQEYVMVPYAYGSGGFENGPPQAHGSEKSILGTIAQNGQNFGKTPRDERNLRRVARGQVGDRQTHRESGTRGMGYSINRYMDDDDDNIGTIFNSICQVPEPTPVFHKLANQLESLGLSDPPPEEREDGVQQPSRGVRYTEGDQADLLHDHRWQRRKQYYQSRND